MARLLRSSFVVPLTATALAGTILIACTPPPNAPIIVSADPDSAVIPAEQAVPVEQGQPFDSFLNAFRADNIASLPSVEAYVSPELGVFFLTHVGAFPRAAHHPSFSDLLAKQDDFAILPKEMDCGSSSLPWLTRDGGFPQYSCEQGRYLSQHRCTKGTLSSGELSEVLRMTAENQLVPVERLAVLNQRAAAIEPLITHYTFDTEEDLGLMFGQVDGEWRLLFVRRLMPCAD